MLGEEAVEVRIALLEEAGLVRALPAEGGDEEERFEAAPRLPPPMGYLTSTGCVPV